jgi:hypothetical protein
MNKEFKRWLENQNYYATYIGIQRAKRGRWNTYDDTKVKWSLGEIQLDKFYKYE